MRTTLALRSILLGIWIYALILWAYIVVDNLIYGFQHQFAPLSVYVPFPEDLLAVLGFAISFVCFVLWNYLRNLEQKSA
jgi:hypothetical protein